MINTIIDNYTSWLRYYVENDGVYRKKAKQLITQLQTIDSLSSLHETLNKALGKSCFSMVFPPIENDPLMKQLNNYLDTVTQLIDINLSDTMTGLDSIPKTPKTKDLIALLQRMLSHPRILFHQQALPLIKELKDLACLEAIIGYIDAQPIVPKPLITRQGTFFTASSIDGYHNTVLDLLRYTAKTYDESNILSYKSNGLLQRALLIYQDIHTVPEQAEPEAKCVIM